MKNSVFKAMRAMCFLVCLALLLAAASYMLAPKDNTAESGINNPNANGFFSEPEDSIDIAVIGNSDAYSGFSPMELWNKYGYTSYVSGEGSQTVAQAYAMLKKILSCQTPKVVILETDGFFTKSKLIQNAAYIINTSLGSSFSVFQYHDRWKRVKPEELFKKPEYTAHCATKGQMLSNDVRGYMGGEYMVKTDAKAKLSLATKTTLDAFVKLCRSNNIELIFVEMPSQSSWNYKKHNGVKAYADKHDIPFLDLNLDRDRFDFDWKTDTRDRGNHLNSRGARKTTLFIGEYLKENYSLTDYRKHSGYAQWHKDYEEYLSEVNI